MKHLKIFRRITKDVFAKSFSGTGLSVFIIGIPSTSEDVFSFHNQYSRHGKLIYSCLFLIFRIATDI